MDKKLVLRVIAVLIASDVLIFGGWFALWSQVPAGSRSWFYQTQYQMTVVEHDPDFGDTPKDVFVEKFTPGLVDMALPASAGVTALAVGWLVVARLRQKSQPA